MADTPPLPLHPQFIFPPSEISAPVYVQNPESVPFVRWTLQHFHLLQVHVSAEMMKSDPHNKSPFGGRDI